MREAIIAMLPKPEKDLTIPESYRFLSMMGVDTKILSKALVSRLWAVVTHLVREEQYGFVPGRARHMNLRHLSHVMH